MQNWDASYDEILMNGYMVVHSFPSFSILLALLKLYLVNHLTKLVWPFWINMISGQIPRCAITILQLLFSKERFFFKAYFILLCQTCFFLPFYQPIQVLNHLGGGFFPTF